MDQHRFWQYLDTLVARSSIVIDRPRGSAHPRFGDFIYPYDYGYLDGTSSGDGDGIDVWVGSQPSQQVVGIISTVDLSKKDAETKILIGCTPNEIQAIYKIHNTETWAGLLVERPEGNQI